jgi:hypothetical protein
MNGVKNDSEWVVPTDPATRSTQSRLAPSEGEHMLQGVLQRSVI